MIMVVSYTDYGIFFCCICSKFEMQPAGYFKTAHRLCIVNG